MKHLYAKSLQILLWILGGMMLSHEAAAQYTSTNLATGKYYTAVATDHLNNVYVTAYNDVSDKYDVLKYTNGTGTPTTIYQGLTYSVSEYPWAIAVNSAGDVFVMNPDVASQWQIIKLAAGTYTSSVIQSGRYFTALTIDGGDNLLAMEYDAGTTNYRVVRYAAANISGAGTTLYNGLPLASGSGTYPWGIVSDHQNNIYIIDFPTGPAAGRLIKLTAPSYAATTLGSGNGYSSIAIDGQGNLYTTETINATTSHVMKYTAPVTTGATGTEIFPSLTISSFFYPWGLAADSHGNIFVGDGTAPGEGRLLKLSPPSISVSSVNTASANPSNANTVQYTVTFSGTANNVTTSAFTLVTTGLTGASVTSVSGSGTTYTVTVNTGTGDGTMRLDVNGNGMGNVITNLPYNTGQVYNIDKTAPTGSLTINSGAAYTNTTTVNLGITSSGATLMSFSTDNVSYTPNEAVATTKSLTLPAGDGLKTVYLKLSDAAGNTQIYQAQITLDQTIPNTQITGGPPAVTNNTTSTFIFIATEPATYEASLDGGFFMPVTSPLSFAGLAASAHTLEIRATDLAGNVDPTPDTYTWTIDQTAPAITSVAVPANDYYHTGQPLNFTVNYNEAVIVNTTGGTPSLSVNIGGITQQAYYVSGSGTTALLFRYTVQDGDMDMDGIAVNSPLLTNGSSIQDAAGNGALLLLQSVGVTTGVFVNTAIPTVTVSATVTSPVNQPFTATITFSEVVTGFVLGDITVTNATLSNFATADNITYTVLVTPAANGATTIQVPAATAVNIGNNGNAVSNTLNIVYDSTAPVINSIDVPANAIYRLGDGLRFKAHFSEAVQVTGTPTLNITIGSTTRQATYQGGAGSDTLGFLYIVQNGDLDMDGITLGAALTGDIQDAAGNNAALTIPAVNTTGILVNTVQPTVVISTTATAPVNQPFTANITFSEAVTGFTAGDITVTNATLSNFQTADNITYTALVTPATDGAATLQVTAGAAVNIGNNPNTASNILSVDYDGTAPVVTSVDVPANNTYHTGDVLSFTVHYSEIVNITGTPTLDVYTDGATRQAALVSGSGTNALLFSYTVQNGDMDMNGITLGSTITGTIRDVAGNNAIPALNSVGSTTGVLINTAVPTVTITTSATAPVIQPFTATITFSEAVTGFAVGDITVTNATLSNFQTTDDITFTVLVTPTADGAATIQVPAGAAVNVGNNGNTASNTLSLVYDGTAPKVTNVDVPPDGIFKEGQTLFFTVHFNEAVNVTGTPTLDVIIGSNTRQASFAGGSGTNALVFSYTIQSNDMDMDGIALGTDITGIIHDVPGNIAVLTLNNISSTTGVLVNTAHPGITLATDAVSPVSQPFTVTITFSETVTGFTQSDITPTNATLSNFLTTDNITFTVLVTPVADGTVSFTIPADVAVNIGNNGNTVSNTLTVVYDGTAPVINSIDVPANGIYHLGDGLRFKAHFSETIAITGTPTLDVVIGGTTRQAIYQGGTGTDTLGFLYIVQSGDVDMDGITLGTTLTGTIQDLAGNNAVLTTPGVNTSGVLVNTAVPTVAITTSATSPAIAPYTATITFSESVNGFTQGDITATNATLSNFQTTDNITYTVLVTPTTDGAVTLQVPASVAVNVGNNPNTASNVLSIVYDGTAPAVTSVAVPANGVYHTGDVLSFTVHYSEIVNITGTPTLDVTIGSTTRQATFVSGSGSDALVFNYTVQNGDMDLDGIALGTAITGTIHDVPGNTALLTLNNAGNTTAVLVNTATPTVAITTSATAPVIAPFAATVTFSEVVTGFTAGDITATNATLSNLQTADNITYTVLVTPTASGTVTIQVPASVAVNVGNNPNTASNVLSLVYDGTAPAVTSVDVPANGVYHTGDVLSFTVHYSEIVNITGTPALDVIIGSTTRQATFVSGSGSDALVFSYTVQNGDIDMDGIVLDTAITGTIHDVPGNNAVLTLNNIGNTTGVLVNTANPGVVISTAATSPVIQPFTANITFSEAVTGFVQADIVVTNATLSSFQTTDNITYTVLITPTADGAVTLQVPASVAVNAGNNANTASNTLSLVYAGTAPVITAVDVPANGTYHLGQVLSFTVHYNESVVVTGTPSLSLVIGATNKQATYVSGSGTDALVFSYTVQAGDMDMDGIATGTVLTGTIRNTAGKDASLTLNNVNSTTGVLVNTTSPGVVISTTATSPVIQPFTASITFSEAVTGFTQADIVVTNATLSSFQTTDNITYTVLVTPAADGAVTLQVPASVAVNAGNNGNTASNTLSLVYAGTAPAVTAVDVPANGTYHLGQVLTFTVHYSENVVVTGTPSLGVVIGATNRTASYVSGSGTNALVFSYTVQAGDMDTDGITLATTLTGTIRNTAGKDALPALNNVGNTTGVLVNTNHPTVVISSSAASRVNAPVTVNIVFSEAVTGLTTTDIVTSNATVSNLQTADQVNYTALLTPIADGDFNVNVPAGAAVNTGGNDNTASNTLLFTYDGTAPVISAAVFNVNFNSPAGTAVGTLQATDAGGTIQQWLMTADGSGGAFAMDANGAVTVKDAAVLSSKAGTTVSITVTVSDGLNTSAPATITINISAPVVNQAPTLDPIDNEALCAGTENHTIQLKGISAVEPGQTYTITVTADQSYFDVLAVDGSGVLSYKLKSNITGGTTNVTVTVKDNGGTANGGVDTRQRTFTITVNSLPAVTITSNKGNTVSKGDIIQLTATGGGSYNWAPVDGIISGQNSAVLQARVMTNNTYSVTVQNAAGCSSTGSIDIAVVADFKVEATNILTPNGDGRNDKWVIRNLDSYPDNEVKVYDRTGRIVYQRKNYSNDWNGTMNGSPLAEGTYYYILTISGGAKTAKGYITIIRDQQ